MTKVRSIRAPEQDWVSWGLRAAYSGLDLNKWIVRSLNRVAELEVALEHLEKQGDDFVTS